MRTGAAMNTPSFKGEIRFDEPMARHTSWRAGGSADRYLMPADLQDLQAMLAATDKHEALLWLGLGSNTLVRDGGFRGSVIAMQGVTAQLEMVDADRVYVGAGVAGAKLARFCARHDLSGGEFFAGIPGLVGGALAMNAGAFGGETWPLVIEVETLNRKGDITKRKAAEFEYGYRSVKARQAAHQDEWFVSATLRLEKQQASSNTIDIKQLLAKRALSQPTGVASCGSVFRNPEGKYAAQLIEDCGLKGKAVGGAVISQKHANFIINEGHATATDIESLIGLIQKTVVDKHGVLLQPEVKIVGKRPAVENRAGEKKS
jgi:UDP-N-acetylmuramate dehydrogenase